MRQCLLQMRAVSAIVVLCVLFVCSAFAPVPCLACGPGPHWVDTCTGGIDLIDDHEGVIGIDLDGDCSEDVAVVLVPCPDGEPLKILRSNPMDDSMIFPGLRVVDGHLDVIDTEIISMCLKSETGFTMTAGAGLGHGGVLAPSYGAIAELASGGPDYPAESFFDIFFEVEIPDGTFLYNHLLATGEVTEKIADRPDVRGHTISHDDFSLPFDSQFCHLAIHIGSDISGHHNGGSFAIR